LEKPINPIFKIQEFKKDFDLSSPEEHSSHLLCGGNFKFHFQFLILFDLLICTKVICKIWILRCWNTYLTATMKLVRALTTWKWMHYLKRNMSLVDKTRLQVHNMLSWLFLSNLTEIIIMLMIHMLLNALTFLPM